VSPPAHVDDDVLAVDELRRSASLASEHRCCRRADGHVAHVRRAQGQRARPRRQCCMEHCGLCSCASGQRVASRWPKSRLPRERTLRRSIGTSGCGSLPGLTIASPGLHHPSGLPTR
jgi:hypothetical protein